MAVTSRDVARVAGVSQPTVSRALRDDPRLSRETKQRVREAADLLGYVLSDAGRALSSGRTRRVGLLVTDLANEFYHHIIAPVHHELAGLGYQLVLHTETTDDGSAAERLLTHGIDAVVLATTTSDSVTPLRLRDRRLPFVYLNRTSTQVEADATVVSPTAGFAAAVDRAVLLGHRRFAAVLGPSNTSTGQSRDVALRAALAEHGLVLEARHVRRGPYDTAVGDEAVTELLALPHPPTAVFCGNDVVAYGALNAARRTGARVPEDVSVVGFDDLPAAAWPIVRLSTIAYDLDQMAREAARLAVRRIDDPEAPFSLVTFDSAFVDRDTLGPVVS